MNTKYVCFNINLEIVNLFLYDGDISLNSFLPSVPFCYPLKTSKNLSVGSLVFSCFQWVQKGTLGRNGSTLFKPMPYFYIPWKHQKTFRFLMFSVGSRGNIGKKWVNPISANALFLYPLKTSENLRFSDVFKGYRNVVLAWKGLMGEFSMLIVKFEHLTTYWWHLFFCLSWVIFLMFLFKITDEKHSKKTAKGCFYTVMITDPNFLL